jgi:hypothetical protein
MNIRFNFLDNCRMDCRLKFWKVEIKSANFTTVYDESAFTSVQIEYGPSLKSIDEDDEMRFLKFKERLPKKMPIDLKR